MEKLPLCLENLKWTQKILFYLTDQVSVSDRTEGFRSPLSARATLKRHITSHKFSLQNISKIFSEEMN